MSTVTKFSFALALAALYGMALAQTGVGVSPPRTIFDAQPGEVITRSIQVDHPGNRGILAVTVGFNDFLLDPKGNAVYLPPASHPRSLLPWISVNPLEFRLNPKATQEVRYTLTIPEDAEPGSYWGIVFFDSEPANAAENTAGVGVRFRVRVGHVIYVNIPPLKRSGAIVGMRYQPPKGDNPAEIRVSFENEGNAALRLSGRVEVRTESGVLVQTARLSDAPSLPGSTHEVGAVLKKPLEPGRYVTLAVFDYGQSDLVAGEGSIEVR